MKVTIIVDTYLPFLTQVASIVNSKNALPILGTIKIETRSEKNTAILTSGDGDMWLQVVAPTGGSDSDFKFCVDAKDLLQALRNLSGRVVTLDIDESKQMVKGEYENGDFSLPIQNANEYPQIPVNNQEPKTIILPVSRIINAVDMTVFAVASDELRPQLNGVHFDFTNESMTTAASDGCKLARYQDNVVKLNDMEACGFTISSKVCHAITTILDKYDGDVKLAFTDNSISISNQQFKLNARLVDGRFPNYNAVIPKNNDVVAVIDRSLLLESMKRVLPFGSSSSELMVLMFQDGKVTVFAENIDFSLSAKETIFCDYNGDKFKIAFKGSYLSQMVSNIKDEKVKFMMKDSSMATLITSFTANTETDFISLLMPMQIA